MRAATSSAGAARSDCLHHALRAALDPRARRPRRLVPCAASTLRTPPRRRGARAERVVADLGRSRTRGCWREYVTHAPVDAKAADRAAARCAGDPLRVERLLDRLLRHVPDERADHRRVDRLRADPRIQPHRRRAQRTRRSGSRASPARTAAACWAARVSLHDRETGHSSATRPTDVSHRVITQQARRGLHVRRRPMTAERSVRPTALVDTTRASADPFAQRRLPARSRARRARG